MARRVFIAVAEVSGDKHAAQLIRSLRQLDPALIVEGVGGPEMAAAGAVIHRETVANAAMGLRGALRAGEMMTVLRWTRSHFEQSRPDLLIGVDSPSMNFHFAKVARGRGVPVLQYVAPQLWAWAAWRMRKLHKWVDRVACILPFEQEYFRAHGVNATFVGHPLFDELPLDRQGEAPAERFPARPPVIGLLPGSRKSEAQHNFPHMLEVAGRIRGAFPGTSFLVPTTSATHPVVEDLVRGGTARDWDVRFEQDRFDEMVPGCDLCLTVSGTATLHVAGFGVPMIVVYRLNPLAWYAGGRWLVRTRTFALVNLLAQHHGNGHAAEHLVPEFVPWYGSNRPVIEQALEYLRHPEKLDEQRKQLRQLVRSLDHPGASMNTAKLAMEMMNGRR